ncbi:MAG: GNAT family N-acetyltransferase, partial [Lachnospiraceae bacterium]|nr:GNAT family N-acetyltransferase [Lachnospiraceae bacterium]
MNHTQIRSAVAADAGRLLKIYAYYVEETAITFDYEVPSLEEFRRKMEHTLQQYPFLVLADEEGVQGYAYAGPFVGRAAYDHSCEVTIYLDH